MCHIAYNPPSYHYPYFAFFYSKLDGFWIMDDFGNAIKPPGMYGLLDALDSERYCEEA